MIAPVALTLLALSSVALLPSIGRYSESSGMFDDGISFAINPVAEDVTFSASLSSADIDCDMVILGSDSLDLNWVGNNKGRIEWYYPSSPQTYTSFSSGIATIVFVTDGWSDFYGDFYLPDLTYWYKTTTHYTLQFLFLDTPTIAEGVYYSQNVLISGDSYTLKHVVLESDESVLDAIGDGLGVIGGLGSGLTSGFDSVFMNGTTLSTIGSFSFILFGLGISVGIVKKCFNWVTGRHGM